MESGGLESSKEMVGNIILLKLTMSPFTLRNDTCKVVLQLLQFY
jgi:hypothetical protein